MVSSRAAATRRARMARVPALVAAGAVAAVLLTACTGATVAAPLPPSPAASVATDPALADYYSQQPAWVDCGDAQCAHVEVPLDYSDPQGDTVSLAVTRLPARGTAVGSLFVNPGGPGGSATEYARAADSVVSDAIRDAYDIVGVDPRGVATSDPVRCLTDAETDQLLTVDGTPDSPEEEQALFDTAALLARECERNAARLLPHVGTVDAARDLDIVRAVLGDSAFNYLGKSYGTLLGATYAELFPETVGRMVLDGVLAPNLDFEQTSHGQAVEFEKVLRDFLRDCLANDGCPFTGTVDDAYARLAAWLQGLDGKPLTADGRDLTEAVAAYAILANLYFPHYDYPSLRSALDAAIAQGDPNELFELLDARISRGPDGHYLDNSTDAYYAVTCLDRPYAGSDEHVRELAQQWAADSPMFGESLAWGMLSCRGWPASGERITDVTAPGANPILLVNATLDPATPHPWAEALHARLAGSRLITWDAVNHTAYGEGSSCVDEGVDAYLLDGTLPQADLTCK